MSIDEINNVIELSNILKENGINDKILKMEVVKPNLVGDHFASLAFNITIHFEGKIPPLELFKKSLPSNPEHAKLLRKVNVFEKEVQFYNDILPHFQKFEIERKGSSTIQDFFPKVYKATVDFVLMENLSIREFGTINKFDKMTFEQSKLVLSNMAKFHSVSYTMMQNIGIEDFKSLFPMTEEFLYNIENSDAADFFQGTFDNAHLIFNEKNEREKKAIETISKFHGKGKVHEFLIGIIVKEENLFNVLNHGDCWIGNIMQKLDILGNPIESKFVDLQVFRVCSPNTDIGNFIFTSVKREIRKEKLRELLQLYFDQLKDSVEKLHGIFAFTFDEFIRDFQKKFYLGFFCGVITVFAGLAKYDPDKGGDFIKGFNGAIENIIHKNPQLAKTIVEEILSLCEEFELISNGII